LGSRQGWSGAWEPLPCSLRTQGLASQATAPACPVDEPKALPVSSLQEKQLLGRNLVRAGWMEAAICAFGFIPAVKSHIARAWW